MTGDEMVGWHHQLNGDKSEQMPGDSKGQGSLTVHGVPKSPLFTSGGQSIGASASAAVLPMNIQG